MPTNSGRAARNLLLPSSMTLIGALRKPARSYTPFSMIWDCVLLEPFGRWALFDRPGSGGKPVPIRNIWRMPYVFRKRDLKLPITMRLPTLAPERKLSRVLRCSWCLLSSLVARSRSIFSKNEFCCPSKSFWNRSWRRTNHHCKKNPNMNANTAPNATSKTFDQSTQCMNDTNKCINVVLPNGKS